MSRLAESLTSTLSVSKQIRGEDQTSLFVHSNTDRVLYDRQCAAGVSDRVSFQRSQAKEKGSPVTPPHLLNNKSVLTDRPTPVIWYFSGKHTFSITHSYLVNGNSANDPLKLVKLRNIWILEEARVLEVFISAVW